MCEEGEEKSAERPYLSAGAMLVTQMSCEEVARDHAGSCPLGDPG